MSKLLIKCQEACKSTKSKTSDSLYCKCTAYDGTDNITQVTELSIDRHEDIGKRISLISTYVKLVITPYKLLHCLVFIAERLNDFLAGHYLLDISIN